MLYTVTKVNGEELYHYGVKGQKWGIRRTPEQLGNKVEKLKEKNKQYTQKVVKYQYQGSKNLPRATNLRNKAVNYRSKEYNLLTSKRRAQELEQKARKLEARASKLERRHNQGKAYVERYLAKINQNEQKISSYQNTIKAMKKSTIDRGNKFFMKYEAASVEELIRKN